MTFERGGERARPWSLGFEIGKRRSAIARHVPGRATVEFRWLMLRPFAAEHGNAAGPKPLGYRRDSRWSPLSQLEMTRMEPTPARLASPSLCPFASGARRLTIDSDALTVAAR